MLGFDVFVGIHEMISKAKSYASFTLVFRQASERHAVWSFLLSCWVWLFVMWTVTPTRA
jgi:hypothetical protein